MSHARRSDSDSIYAELRRAYLEEPMRTPEARAYAEARSLDELCYAGGQYVAAHAFQMTRRLGLNWHGLLPLALFRVVARKRWHRYVKLRLDAFAACVVADLSALRELLTRGRPSPEDLPTNLQRLFAMACVHAGSTLKLTDDEKKILLNTAASHIAALLDHPDSEREVFVQRVLDLPAVKLRQIGARRTVEFVGKAMLEGTALNVVAFVRNLERLSG